MQIGVAIDIPPPWGAALTLRRIAAGDLVAIEIPAHLTLLGPTDVDPERLLEIEDHLAGVATAQPSFLLQLRGTGTFRPVTQVVFVALATGISECEQLAAEIRSAPALPREQRFPYHPHVTVAQDVPAEALDAVFEELADFTAQFTVDGFTLFERQAEGGWRPRRNFVLGRR